MWLRILCLLVGLGVLDLCFVRQGFAAPHELTLRFFLIHCVTNMIVIWYTAEDVLRVIRKPETSIFADFSWIPLQCVGALHIYHFKDYRHLTMVDWVHHISVLVLSALTVFYHENGPGPLCNFCLFFICGLPGLIDYIMLVARGWDRIASHTEKKWNTVLHLWVRCPGLIIYSTIAYIVNSMTGHRIPLSRLCFFVVPVFFNGIYFAHRVSYNYGFVMGRSIRKRSERAVAHGTQCADRAE